MKFMSKKQAIRSVYCKGIKSAILNIGVKPLGFWTRIYFMFKQIGLIKGQPIKYKNNGELL